MNVRRALGSALALLATACTTSPDYATLRPIPADEILSVGTIDSSGPVAGPESTGQQVGKTAGQAAAGGAAYGASAGLHGGIICGPLMPICSATLALVGAGAGAVIGTAGGGIHGALRGIPSAKADEFELIIEGAFTANNYSVALRDSFVAQSHRLWRTDDLEPTVRLLVNFENIDFDERRGDQIVMTIDGAMVVQYGYSDSLTTRKYLFTHTTAERNVDEWLVDGGSLFLREMDAAISSLAFRMIEILSP